MSETITRAEANKKIAEFMEEKPEDLEQKFYHVDDLPKSEGKEWIWRGNPEGQWKPNHDYCGRIAQAHRVAMRLEECESTSFEVYVTFAFEGLGADFCNLFARPDAAKMICEAFLYATTGTRYEIVD